MMTVNNMKMPHFADHFWGEKNNGFDVLYHNMKLGQSSSKEFLDFLRESCSIEENYAKMMNRLAKQLSNCCTSGSFSPFWVLLKSLVEKICSVHLQLMHSWQDLIKDVHRYQEEQHKKHKSVKDSEASTLETVQNIQQTIAALQKAKENYHARSQECDRLKRENASQKDIEKVEAKYRRAHDEYKTLVEKYGNIRNEFEEKMTQSSKSFQEVEEHHLRQMKDFVDTYCKAWEHQHALLGQVHEELRINSNNMTVENLLETMIQSKKTGTEKPGPIEFDESSVPLPPPGLNDSADRKEFPIIEKPSKTGTMVSNFLSKSKREKKKDKKKKKVEKKDKNAENTDEQTQPEVDEEGYRIQPENRFENYDNKSSSSSDSDSDSEEKRKIKVEIKPVGTNGNAAIGNVDDIRRGLEGLRLSPTTTRKITTSSGSDISMKSGKSSAQDLLGLDLFAPSSSASTPTGGNYAFPGSNSQKDSNANTPVAGSTDFFAFSGSTDLLGSLAEGTRRAGTPTGGGLLPGPPSSRASPRSNFANFSSKATARPTGRQSPAPGSTSAMYRADSIGNLNNTFNTTSMSVGSSRGPSPLTIGMSDSIPIAVAFFESVNALFKGSDENSCRAKVIGDMTLSFPAGIVKVLTENPSPAVLSFRIKNNSCLENSLVNKQLLSQDFQASGDDSTSYKFDMTALTEHLRKQAETNKTASHFNVDLIKYQVKLRPGTQSLPLHLVSFWKCEPTQTDVRIDYKYNSAAISKRSPLSSCNFLVPVDGEVTHMQSKPTATWMPDNKRARWNVSDISDMNEEGGQGCLRAKFDLASGPSTASPVAVQFVCEGSTLSNVDFELLGSGYRVSLIKRRFVTGKYMAEPENAMKYV